MKKLTIIGFIVALAIAGVFLSHHFKHLRDTKVRPMLPGTWAEVWGDGKHPNIIATNVVGVDGRYLRHMIHLKTHRIIDVEGVYQISNGVLINTVTKNSEPEIPAPATYHGLITSSSSNEIVAEFEGGYATVHYKRVAP